MGKINVLSTQVANLIAAGEVVDRPASVVKELIENSIDAHAKNITVEIKNGGVSFIRVSDDGGGISPEDMPLALKRHATSKIAKAQDLNAIFTLGFRGEALAAISSVSKVRIISKTADNASGTMLYADGGDILEVREVGCPNGTTITVEELFANVPARRKFLKKDSTEAAAVCASVEKVALSHPEIAFRLISDGNVKLESSGNGKLDHTIYSILGKDFAKRLLPVKYSADGVDIYGYIGRSDNVKPTRNFQNFFINHRYVKSRTAMAALEQAYSSYIAPERFPSCVLFIDIHPGAVDVNVHPAKLEVKFSNEKLIFDSVYYAVRSTIEKNIDRPELILRSPSATAPSALHSFVPVVDRADIGQHRPEQARINSLGEISFASNIPDRMQEEERRRRMAEAERFKSSEVLPQFSPKPEAETLDVKLPLVMPEPQKTNAEPMPKPSPSNVQVDNTAPQIEERAEIPDYRIIGVAFNTYIFVETEKKVVVIDKHAAHERILFESLRGKLRGFEPAPQLLLVPITLGLSQSDFSAVVEYSDDLKEIGFDFELSEAQRQVKLLQIPSALKISEVEDVFAAMADRLSCNTGSIELTKQEAYERSLYQASCKAAMKGGRVDSESDVRFVVEKILTIPDITVCPHGRPVVINLNKSELDRKFGRE